MKINDYISKVITGLILFSLTIGFLYPLNALAVTTLSTDGAGSEIITIDNPKQNTGVQLQPTGPGTIIMGTDKDGNPTATPAAGDGQSKAAFTGNVPASTTPPATSAVGKTAAEALGCVAGGLLAQVIAQGISVAIAGLFDAADYSLPVKDIGLRANGRLETAAHTSINIFGFPTGVSWDGISWCIVNSIISYIADSTIRWANSGFNGNPSFVQNPERFFKGLADQQASQFIQQLAYDTTGFNVCKPFRAQIAIGLANSYNNNTGNKFDGSCSLDTVKNNVSGFAKNPITVSSSGGQSPQAGINNYWKNWNQTRQDQNNPFGAYLLAQDYMNTQISMKNNTMSVQLQTNGGFLSFYKCEDPEAAKKGDTRSCNVTTPGKLVQSSLEKSLNLPKDRLVLASKFDQVVTAIVNNLIKVALDKVLTPSNAQPPVPRGVNYSVPAAARAR